MREILFKAKRIDNGEWVEGSLIDSGNHSQVCIYPHFNGASTMSVRSLVYNRMVAVDADTICQYTGLTDKHGNKIWENDIISYPKIHAKGNVAFMEDTFVLFDDWDGKQYINGMWNKFKVIGNIFDNADLVKE